MHMYSYIVCRAHTTKICCVNLKSRASGSNITKGAHRGPTVFGPMSHFATEKKKGVNFGRKRVRYTLHVKGCLCTQTPC